MTDVFPDPSRRSFAFPIGEDTMRHFVHPDSEHAFHEIYRDDKDQLVAANGDVAIRVYRGYWIPAEWPAMPEANAVRLADLPWHLFAEAIADKNGWQKLDDISGQIFRFGVDPVFVLEQKWKLGDTIAVRVADGPDVPLSILQLIARLPRVEFYTEHLRRDSPVLFRFSTGFGILAPRKSSPEPKLRIFQPKRHHEDGSKMRRPTAPKPNFNKPPEPEPMLEGWPPAEVE